MSKKANSLKKLSDKDLAKLIGGASTATTSIRSTLNSASMGRGDTWLYDCWEGGVPEYAPKGTVAAPAVKPVARPASY